MKNPRREVLVNIRQRLISIRNELDSLGGLEKIVETLNEANDKIYAEMQRETLFVLPHANSRRSGT